MVPFYFPSYESHRFMPRQPSWQPLDDHRRLLEPLRPPFPTHELPILFPRRPPFRGRKGRWGCAQTYTGCILFSRQGVSTAAAETLTVSCLVLDSPSSRGGSLWNLRVLEWSFLCFPHDLLCDLWILQDFCRWLWQRSDLIGQHTTLHAVVHWRLLSGQRVF